MGELRVGGRCRGGEDVVPGAGGSVDDSASESMAASFDSGASSGSLCSSIMSSLTDDDDAESSPVAGDPTPSSPSDTMQLGADGGGPLYELSPLMAHLPVRTGLSKYCTKGSPSPSHLFPTSNACKISQRRPPPTSAGTRAVRRFRFTLQGLAARR